MSPTALAEKPSPEGTAADGVRSALDSGRLLALGVAVVVGVPASVELSRFVTTIVLSLILGH